MLAGRAKISGHTVDEERTWAFPIPSLKSFADPKDIAALAVILASDAGKSISGVMLRIDDAARAS